MIHRRRRTAVDPTRAGLSFVEVLFALVVAQVLEPFRSLLLIPAAGLSHLGLALVLTVTSWVGYHNSWNRPRHFIRFANLALAQFAIDILLVITYWFCAISAEFPASTLGRDVSAVPESLCVAVSFCLYVLWDFVGFRIRRSDLYDRSPPDRDVPQRRRVTQVCAAAAVGIAVVVTAVGVDSAGPAIAVDVGLLGVILAFRFAKEWFTPEDAYPVTPAPTS
jgi:hypothetical protein